MKLGLIARADNTGLGTQTWEFYRYMKPAKTMVVDISSLNGNQQFFERYPNASHIVHGFPNLGDIREFLEGLDVVFVAESPYNYALYSEAKRMGVKVAVQYNYEFFDWYSFPHFPTPDMLIAPSRWHFDDIAAWAKERDIPHIYLHCPVNRKLLPKRVITKARSFIHVEGKAAAHDRNGTDIVRHSNSLLPEELQVKILTQSNGAGPQNYWEVYAEGDVLVLPRRYGGNCLPLNEALSVGMPVIMTDITPNNRFLPGEWLIPARIVDRFTPRMVVDIYEADAQALADKIKWFAALDEYGMEGENIMADTLATSIAWTTLQPLYERAFEELRYVKTT